MRIGIDARAYDWTGIGRYARNLLRALSALSARTTDTTYVVFAHPRVARAIASLPQTEVVAVRDSYYSVYEQTGFLLRVLQAKVDLVHFLNFNAPIFYRRPFVVTIHDLTRFAFQGQKHQSAFHQWAYTKVFRSAVEGARAVIAVSETTRQELAARFPSATAKTSVIAEGVDERFFRGRGTAPEKDQRVLLRLGLSKPYLLYVGLWMRHKNLPGLIQAFRRVKERGFPGNLVITGEGRPWDEDIRALAVRAEIAEAVKLPGRVHDGTLAVLYRNAAVFVFPSFSEGFGLPPLEAMASGTPVVAARAGSLPEVLGEAALYADPKDPENLANAIQMVLTDTGVRARLVQAGSERARRYTWSMCGVKTAAVYARILSG